MFRFGRGTLRCQRPSSWTHEERAPTGLRGSGAGRDAVRLGGPPGALGTCAWEQSLQAHSTAKERSQGSSMAASIYIQPEVGVQTQGLRGREVGNWGEARKRPEGPMAPKSRLTCCVLVTSRLHDLCFSCLAFESCMVSFGNLM